MYKNIIINIQIKIKFTRNILEIKHKFGAKWVRDSLNLSYSPLTLKILSKGLQVLPMQLLMKRKFF